MARGLVTQSGTMSGDRSAPKARDAPYVNASPLFTIVTVCLDSAAHIAEAIESVLDQTFGDFEYVIVDGGSTDGTLDVVREYERRVGGRIRCVSEPDEGLFDAMNKALSLAKGEYVEFLGADDRLEPGGLAVVAAVVRADPRPDIVCGATYVFGPDGSWREPARTKVRGGLAQRAPARHQSIFVRRDAILSAGGFDLRFRIAADYELYLRLVEAGNREVLIGDTLSQFRLGGASSINALATAREYRDARIAHGASPLLQEIVMLKSALAATLFAAWKHAVRLGGRACR